MSQPKQMTSKAQILRDHGIPTQNGFILWQGPSPETGEPLVAVCTGVRRASANEKTGRMIQLWILRSDIPPHEAFTQGLDSATCGNCIHSGSREGTCYVRTFDAPLAVYNAFKRDAYPVLDTETAVSLLKALNLKIRLGAYGDPAMLPFEVVKAVAFACPGWTGYTHQTNRPWFDDRFHTLLMVSLEGEGVAPEGTRSFRILSNPNEKRPGEILCPATAEGGHKANCSQCTLCRGSSLQAKSVALVAHGKASKKLLKLLPVLN